MIQAAYIEIGVATAMKPNRKDAVVLMCPLAPWRDTGKSRPGGAGRDRGFDTSVADRTQNKGGPPLCSIVSDSG
jgi:hypothetical protein